MANQCEQFPWVTMVITFLVLLTGCASFTEPSSEDPLAEYRVGELRSAVSQAELVGLLEASRDLKDVLSQRRRESTRQDTERPAKSAAPESGQDNSQAQELDRVRVTGTRISAEDLITNVQTAGIDEGGIFKRAGDRLVILSGNWIHTVRIYEDGRKVLKHEQSLRLQPDTEDPAVWFDELIAFDSGLLVLSYDFKQNYSGIHVFLWDDDGQLQSRGRMEIAAEDYYSGSNYGFRLVGGSIMFPVTVNWYRNREPVLPMWRSVNEGEPTQWEPLVEADDILLPVVPVEKPVIYSVLRCGLDEMLDGKFDCRTHGLLSEAFSELYVSNSAAYVAVDSWRDEAFLMDGFSPWHGRRSWAGDRLDMDQRAQELRQTVIYRIPLDADQAAGVVAIHGGVGNQFSFQEIDRSLIAVTELDSDPDNRQLGAYRIPATDFGPNLKTGIQESWKFATLPVSNDHRTVRVTDEMILVGEHSRMRYQSSRPIDTTQLIVQKLSGGQWQMIPLTQSVDRIEPVGDRVFVSGVDSSDDWTLGLVDASSGSVGQPWVSISHANAEDRSHAFNWRELEDGRLLLGLPGKPIGDTDSEMSYWERRELSADLMFLVGDGLNLLDGGVIGMQADERPDTDCGVTDGCADWYGNARIAFIDDRIFALSGNQLAEARFSGGRVIKAQKVLIEP